MFKTLFPPLNWEELIRYGAAVSDEGYMFHRPCC